MTGRARLGLVSVVGGCLIALLAGLSAASGAAPPTPHAYVSPATYGPTRLLGGMLIQSLDPLPAGRARIAPAPAIDQTSRLGADTRHRKDEILSNEVTFTRWAYVVDTQVIRKRPTTSSRRITHLHWFTEDGFPEIYLLLRAHWDAHGTEWIKLRIPGRPNGRIGWARRTALGRFHLTHLRIVVDRERLRLYFYTWGHLVWSTPVGVGKPSTPTPAGRFWIREREKIYDPLSGYWPYYFVTSDYSTLSDWPDGGVVGIHGPYYAPQLIPGHISHGCIRLPVIDDAWLATRAQLGTPVRIL